MTAMMKVLSALILFGFVGSGLSMIVASPASLAHSARGDASLTFTHAPRMITTTSTSSNWAGYAVKTANGAVSDVKGQWNVPQIAVACPTSYRASSFWVGIDGDGTSTVEQTGTSTDCSGGSPSYYAWYEFYPAGSHVLSMIISPADHMSGEVKYSTVTKKFTVILKDLTTGKSFSISKSMSTAKRASAEWIAEAPSNSAGIIALTNFGWVTFNNSFATISGHTHSIGGFSNIAITMWNLAGTAKKAVVGGLVNSGKKFTVTWKSAGP